MQSNALDVAIDIIHQAGALVKEARQRGPARVQTKQSAIDLVTETDVASERLIIDALRRHFPDHGVYGEESGQVLPETGPVWVIDPIDGTTNFAHGLPIFCVTMALLVDRQVEVGVTYDPIRDETYWAQRGRGAWRNGQRMQVSTTASLGSSLVATGFPYDRASNRDDNLAESNYFTPLTRGIRRIGSAALDMAWVAAGWLDGYWERGIQIWDLSAGALLIREAGGLVTTYAGRPWQPGDRNVVASNGVDSMHAALLEGIQTARQALPPLS